MKIYINFIFVLIIIFNIVLNTQTYFKYQLDETNQFEKLYLRKIDSTHIYLGNQNIEGIYDLTLNQYISSTSVNSIWFQGNVSPYLLFSKSTNQPKYIISADTYGKKLRIIFIKQNYQFKDYKPFEKGVIDEEFLFNFFQIDDNKFIINSRTQRIGGFGGRVYIRIFDISIGKNYLVGYIDSNWQGGGILLEDNENAPYLEFHIHNLKKLHATFYDLRLKKKNDVYINSDKKQLKGYFQSIELNNHIIITCHILEEGISNVDCFSGQYNNNNYNLLVNWKTILNNCPSEKYYSIYKFNSNKGIIGCYKNGELELKIINSTLYSIKTIISDSNFQFADFTSIDQDSIIIAIARKNSNNLIEYVGINFSCPKRIITINKELTFFDLTDNIEILQLPSKGQLYKINILFDNLIYEKVNEEIKIGNTYNFNNLLYIPNTTNLNDTFQYKNVEDKSYENIIIKEECDMRIIICHEYCESCITNSDSISENCIKCKEGYFMNPYIKGNCIPNCEDKAWYYDNNYKFHCLSSSNNCGNNNMLFIEANRQCVDSCKNTELCEFCKTHDLYKYKKLCLLGCVEGTIRKDDECVESEELDEDPQIEENEEESQSNQENENENENFNPDNQNNYYNDNDESDNFDPNFFNNDNSWTNIFDEPNYIGNSVVIKSSLNEKGFLNNLSEMADLCFNMLNTIGEKCPQIATIVSSMCKYDYYATDLKEKDRKEANISYVNLGECENKLRVHYNIPPQEKIYIGQNKCYEYVDYKVYNEKKEELDLSICKGINIKVSTPIDPSNPKIGLLLAIQMQEEGIDIYNKDEEVFNDKCSSLSLNGKDLSMEARQKDIYKDVSEFCNENCIPHVNTNTYEIECDCPTVKNENEKKDDDNINSFLEENEYISMISNIFSSTNIHLFKCFKKFKNLNIKDILSNKGFIICGGITISQFILSSIFLFTQINNIFSLIFKNLNVASPIKIKNSKITNNSNDEFIENTIIKQNSLNIYKDKKYKDENYDGSSSKRMIEFEKKKISKLKMNRKNKDNENSKEEFTNDELNELTNFEDVLDLDKRGFFSYYISIFVEKQIFFSTIFKKSLFYPLSFRLLIFFFTIQCFLFLNALFFTQEYLNKRYRAKKLDFVYIIKNEITKSLYASIIVLLIGKIVNIFTTITIDYLKITKNINDKKYLIRLKNIIFEIKKKFYIIIVIMIIFSFIFWYFLFIFCDIYKNNQMSWILSTFISFIVNILIPFCICIIITILRFISLKIKSDIIFEISLMIYSLL